jgi:hypothetical protein
MWRRGSTGDRDGAVGDGAGRSWPWWSRAYAFDLISPERLLQRWVGREVELVESGDRPARARDAGRAPVHHGGNVYRIGDRIAVGHPGRVVLPNLPEDLSPRPALRWRLANSGPARTRSRCRT